MTAPDPPRGFRPWFWLLLLLAAGGLAAGVVLWQRFDPFATERPSAKAAKRLLDVARKQPLSVDEFAEAVALLESGEPLAQLPAIAVLQLEAERDPARRVAALDALDALKNRPLAGANVAAAASAAAARIRGK